MPKQAPPPTRFKDLDAEDRESLSSAVGDTISDKPQTRKQAEALTRSGELTALDGVPIPKFEDLATAESAVAWVEQEVLRATPRAIQEVIYAMKRSGEQKIRLGAALQILDRAGVKEKQAATAVAPVIVLNNINLPWVKQAKDAGVVKDGKLVEGAAKVITDNAKKDRT